jgi:hypothetical protein
MGQDAVVNSQQHPSGGYRFLPAIKPYSAGVRASEGHGIRHVTFRRPPAWRDGFAAIAAHLTEVGRPSTSLCSIELRSPEPHSFAGFGEFNTGYRDLLGEWGLLVDDVNPVARTNVAPLVGPPSTTALYGFGYTVATDEPAPSFVIAGAGDLHDQADLSDGSIVRPADDSTDAWTQRIGQVMEQMATRMASLSVGWDDVTVVNVYTVGPLGNHVEADLLSHIGQAAAHGIRWHVSHPPIIGLTFEMDVRSTAEEIWI